MTEFSLRIETPEILCKHCGVARRFHGTCDTCPSFYVAMGNSEFAAAPQNPTWWEPGERTARQQP